MNFGIDRHDGALHKYQCQHTAPPVALFRSRYYPVGASGSYLFGFSDGYGKVGVDPRTTHLTYQKFGCFIDGDDFVLSWSRKYSSMIR